MAQTELVTMQLPSGEQVDVEVPLGWSDQQVTEYVDGLGLFGPAKSDVPKDTGPTPSRAEQFLYGAAKTPGLVEQTANLLEQKLTPKTPERTRGVYTGGDVPMVGPNGDVQMDPRYPEQQIGTAVLPAVTEQSIRAQQKQAKQDQLATDFPNLVGKSDTGWVKAGAVTRMLTDMATFPLPFTNQLALGKFAADGGKLLSAEGRALWGKAAMEGGSSIGLFGAADQSIRQLADTGKLSPGDVGMAGLVSMAGGAVIGPVLAGTGGKFIGWVKGKMQSGQHATAEEVGAVSEAMGHKLTDEEMVQLADAVNRAGDRAVVESATVDLLHSPKTAMSITKDGKKARVLTKEEKKVRAEMRKAFADDPEMADHLKRQAEEIVADRERAAAQEADRLANVEKQRQFGDAPPNSAMADAMKAAYAAKGQEVPQVSKVMDELRLQQIKDRQDAALADLEHLHSQKDLPGDTVEVVTKTREAAKPRQPGYDRPGILGNQEVVLNKKGLRSKWDVWGNKLFERVAQYSGRVAMGMRKVQTETNRNTRDVLLSMRRWLYDPEITKAFKKNGEFRRAVHNSDEAAMDRIVPGSAEVYRQEVKPVIGVMRKNLMVNGHPVLKDVLHPRAVKSVDGVRAALNREQRSKYDLIVEKWKLNHPGRGEPDVEDVAGMIGQVIGGRHLPQDRSRRVLEVTAEAEKYYVNPRSALIDAVTRHQEGLAMQKFMQQTLGKEKHKLFDVPEAGDIKKLLAEAIDKGELAGQDALEMGKLLNIWMGISRQAPGRWQQRFHNFISFEALGFNPYATLTQLADQFNNASRFHVGPTLRAMFPGKEGKIMTDAYEAGVRSYNHDLRTPEGMQRVLREGLTRFGFDKLDHKFSDQGSRLAVEARYKQAMADPEGMYKEMTKWFEPDAARKLVQDLRAGKMTGDIAALVSNDVADVRPQGMLDMPESYAAHPNWRFAYSLMSWTMNQMNYVRNKGIVAMRNGIRTGNKELIKQGGKTLAYITLLNSMGGMAVGTLKDFIRGNGSTDEMSWGKEGAYALGGALPLALAGKYVLDKMLQGRGGSLDFLPAASILDEHLKAVGKLLTTGELSPFLKASGWGRALYSLLTGADLISAAEASTHKPLEQVIRPKGEYKLPEPVYTNDQLAYQQAAVQQKAPSTPRGQAPAVNKPRDLATTPEQSYQPMKAKDGTQLTVPKDMPAKATLDVSRELIRKREGERDYVYRNAIQDKNGNWKWDEPTSGIGHVLLGADRAKYPMGKEPEGGPKKGAVWKGATVPKDKRDDWFKKDSTKAWNAARKQAKELGRMDMVPALASMIYQNGEGWNKIHTQTWKKLKDGMWFDAAAEAGNSLWARQTPARADDFQRAIRAVIK